MAKLPFNTEAANQQQSRQAGSQHSRSKSPYPAVLIHKIAVGFEDRGRLHKHQDGKRCQPSEFVVQTCGPEPQVQENVSRGVG